MATQKLTIIGQGEVRIKMHDQEKSVQIGTANKYEAPDCSKYLVCKLDKYWIINEEDYKLLKQTKSCKK